MSCYLYVCFESKSLLGFVDKIIKEDHGKIVLKKYNFEWQNLIDLLLKKNYINRPNIEEVLKLVIDLGQKSNLLNLSINSKNHKINKLNEKPRKYPEIRSKTKFFILFIFYSSQ